MDIIKTSVKRITAITIVLMMLLTYIPFYAIAEELDNNENVSESSDVNVNENNDKSQNNDEGNTLSQDKIDSIDNGDAKSNDIDNQNELNSNQEEQNNNVSGAKGTKAPALRGSGNGDRSIPNDEGFKVALRWGGTSNPTYTWNATQNEDRVIKLTFYYQNEVSPRAYAPGDIKVIIPGIGGLNRNGIKKASDIAADVYGAQELKRDWSYKYDAKNDIYTFYNNHAIEQGETFNGSFEMIYEFNSRAGVNGFEKIIQGTLNDGHETVVSQNLNIEYTSKRDTFYIEKNAEALLSYDGLGRFVPEGKTARDYAWVKYTFRYNVENLNARALKSRYMLDTFPEGCVVAQNNNIIRNEDGTITYKVPETSVPENNVRTQSIVVGYPDNMVGQTIDNTAYLYGTYYEEEEPVLLDDSTVSITLERILPYTAGVLISKDISPEYVYRDSISNSLSFSARLRANIKTSSDASGVYSVAITDDIMELCSQDKTDPSKNVTKILEDDEYTFSSITVPGVSSFTDGNGYPLEQGDYDLKLYALYKSDVTEGDLSTRALSNYTQVFDGKWTNNGATVNFSEDVLAVRAELSGIIENIPAFYINVSGRVKDLADNIEAEEYVNPKYIINHEFTEYEDEDGHSLIIGGDYTRQEIYDRDVVVYGSGVARTYDTIVFRDREINPGYYYGNANINPFSMDESGEYFETVLEHSTRMNNIDRSEIKSVEVHGVAVKEDLETLIETLSLTYSGLTFKNSLPSDVNMQDYLMERANITKDGNEIKIVFNFNDNPIVSTSFSLGYKVDARVKYEDYFVDSNPSYSVRTYAYTPDGTMRPNSTASHEGKTMAVGSDSENILLALASHQQLIKMVKTTYSGDFVEEDAVTPMNDTYTYRLKLRNGYNTLLNTEFVDILEHSELTEVDGAYPYNTSEWYGTFNSVDTSYMEGRGYTTRAYYANTLTPGDNDWTLMESHQDGIWTTVNSVKAVKVCIDGEISENSIVYVDVNMDAPYDLTLEDKIAYNSFKVNGDAIDLYSGIQSSYMRNMPSNEVNVRLVEKTYDIYLTKLDAANGAKLNGARFGIYDSSGQKIGSEITGILGYLPFKNLKAGTYTIKEEVTPAGYKTVNNYVLTISSTGHYTVTSNNQLKAEGDATLENNIPTIRFNIENERAKGKIIVHKIDEYKNSSQEEIPLANVQFELLNQEGAVIGTQTTNAEGNATFNNLGWGKNYTIHEVSALQGYEPIQEENIYLSRVDLNENTHEIEKVATIENKRKTGSAELTKQDEIDGTKLEGAKYGLFAEENIYDKEGNILYEKDELIEEKTTDENGKVNFDELIWGDYYLKETKTVYGYELSDEKHIFTINAQNVDTLVEKTENEERSKAKLQLVKIDDKGAMIQGVEFGLYNADDDSEALRKEVIITNELKLYNVGDYGWKQTRDGIWKSDNYNAASTSAEMESNEFTILETEVLSFDWSVSSQSASTDYLYYTITDTTNNTIVSGTGTTTRIGGTSYGTTEDSLSYVNVQKELQPGTYKLKFSYKKDASTNTGLDKGFVKNIQINCEDYEIESYVPINGITNEVGQLNLENIEWGTYYLKEIKTIDGYEKLDTKFYFTVDRNTFKNNNTTVTQVLNEDTDEQVSIIRNKKKQGKVILTKYAAEPDGTETDTTLENAEYDLYLSNGTLIDTYTTNNEGKIEAENLEWGSYYFLEKNAPAGYSTSDKKISFVINAKNVSFVQEFSAYDKPESGEITINKIINANELYSVHGNATFMFKIVGKDAEENEKIMLYRTITFSEEDIASQDTNGNITKTIKISDIEPYKYLITEEDNYRYELDEIIPVTNAEVNEETGIVNLTVSNNKGEITFANDKASNSLLTDSQVITNSMQSEFYPIGISVEPKESGYAIGTGLNENDFTVTLLYSGGQEVILQTVQNFTINGEGSYTQSETGNYIATVSCDVNGKTYEADVTTTWTMPRDYFTYTINSDGTINITGINSNYTSPEVLFIPSEWDERIVKQVGRTGTGLSIKLTNIDNVKTVQIAEGVTSIGNYAFYECSSLTEIDIPEGVISIGESTFRGCSSLTEVDIPEGVTSIGNHAFSGCSSLTEITIPEGVTSIGQYAFYKCINLTEITILEGVTSIGQYAFSGCSSLTEIDIPEGATSIEGDAFSNCSRLTRVELPDSLTSIGRRAFNRCSSLTEINIPEGVTEIGGAAFEGCSSLTSIEIPEGVTSLASTWAYSSSGKVYYGFFEGCTHLTNVELPDTLTSIGNEAFYRCSSLTGINIPEGVTSIGDSVFCGCSSLTEVDIPEGVTIIGYSAFNGCSSLTEITIPEGVTSIGNNAFAGCSSLTEVTIPEGVTSIGNNVFNGCSSLTEITIPEGVTSIGDGAFYGCSSLTEITIPEGVTSIGNSAFNGCSNLTEITIPEGVTSIGDSTFRGCSGLTSVTIPEGVTSIEKFTFYKCSNLTEITIPEGVTSIGKSAFYRCSSLTEITIPDSVTSIGSEAFSGCSSLTEITIPDSVTSIENGTFYGCSNLTTVKYTGSEEQFNAITIGSNNQSFINATKIYNYDPDNP